MMEWSEMAKPGQYTLGELIDRLKAAPLGRTLKVGFLNPHSYRGYYEDLAFEPFEDVTVGQMLAAAESAVGVTFQGYKGGDYVMDADTSVWLALDGTGGAETLGRYMMDFMLANEAAT